MSPYIVKQKKIKSGHPVSNYQVAPIYLRDTIDFGNQLACEVGKVSQEDTRQALEIARDTLNNNSINFIAGIVTKNLKAAGIDVKPEEAVKTIIERIPIYLVCKKPFTDKNGNAVCKTAQRYSDGGPHDIPNDECLVEDIYNISLGTLKEWLETNDVPNLKDHKMSLADILGLYCKDGEISNAPAISSITNKRRIFLWIDKIADIAFQFKIDYKLLLALVLCHEFMHALMDLFDKIVNPSRDWGKVYYHFREESLANGLAIYLMKQHLGDKGWQLSKLEDFVKSQPDAYKLGLKYQDGINLQKDVQEWIDIKRNWNLTDSQIKTWLRNITKNQNNINIPIMITSNNSQTTITTINNPWANLNLSSSTIVAPCDQQAIQHLVNKYPKEFHLDLYPEPFIGSLDADVYLLNLNPGFGKTDPKFIGHKQYVSFVKNNLEHKSLQQFNDFYYFNSILDSKGNLHGGCRWWLREGRYYGACHHLEKALGRFPKIFVIEYFPYHTKDAHPIPTDPNYLPSYDYSNQLIIQAMKAGKTIVVLRHLDTWTNRIPGLQNYKNLITLPRSRRVWITPKTLGKQTWDDLLKKL